MNKNKVSGIYAIICRNNGKFYLGSSNDFHHRKSQHFSRLKHNNHHCKHLQHAFNLYGENAFFFIICEEVLMSQLENVEQQYLDEIKQFRGNECFNSSFLSDRIEFTLEIRQKISSSMKGENNPHYGKRHTLVSRQKMKEARMQQAPPNYDHTIYKFKNKITNEIFEGTQCIFYQKYSLNTGNLSQLISGRYKSIKNWVLIK